MQRQVAGHLVAVLDRLDRGALEADAGELLGVEEVWAAQVLVALVIVGVDAFRLEAEAEEALAGVVGVEGETTGDVVEAAVDRRDAEVADLERDAGMYGVDAVVVGGPGGRGGGQGQDDGQN